LADWPWGIVSIARINPLVTSLPELYADIVLPMPLDKAFTYRVPERYVGRVAVGMRAVVPVMNRMETGFIVGLKASTEVEKLKDIVELPGDSPDFDPAMLRLCRWLANYYNAPYPPGCGWAGWCAMRWLPTMCPRAASPRGSGRPLPRCIGKGR
jgi:primosomal protein N'